MNKRIIIIGEAGRGKTTLARKLSKKLEVIHHQTDDFFWEIKYSKPFPREDALQRIKEEYGKDSWIIDGTTQWLIEPGLEKADIILFLHFKTIFHQWFMIIYRSITEKRESFKELYSLLKHVFYKRFGMKYKKGKITHKQLIEPYKNKVIVLDSFRKINRFVKEF